MTANPLSATEIASWCWLRGIRLLEWELEALEGFDAEFLDSITEAAKQPKPAGKK